MQLRWSIHLILLGALSLLDSRPSEAAQWELAGARWQAKIDGETGTEANAASTGALGLERNYNNMVTLALNHSVALLPQVLFAHTDASYSGDAVITESFSLGSIFFDAQVRTLSDFELSHTDLTLHYRIVSRPLQLNVGLTTRMFDGYVEAESELTQPTRSTFEGVVPMAYVKLATALPLKGWNLQGTANVIRYRGDGFHDYTIRLGYVYERDSWGLGVNVGYRNLLLDVANFDDLYVDGSLSGSFVEGVFRF